MMALNVRPGDLVQVRKLGLVMVTQVATDTGRVSGLNAVTGAEEDFGLGEVAAVFWPDWAP